jgi:GIY-YIG catalytic domain
MEVVSGVYAITCLVTGQTYVGSGISWEHRIKSHFRALRRNRHDKKLMQETYNEYGPDQFEVVLLEECPIDDLLKREAWWVEELDTIETGFNSPQLGSNGFLTHGRTFSREFKSWESMKQRCLNSNAPDYPKYGAKGIKVHGAWLNFDNFYADMGQRPIGTSLDRYPNKSGNYEPGNCRWATPREQQANRDCVIEIEFQGKKRLLFEVADEVNMPRDLLRKRYYAGMMGDELFAPSYSRFKGLPGSKKRKRIETRHDLHRYEYQGKMRTILELSELTGIPRDLLSQRLLKYKMTLEKALSLDPLKRGKTGPRKGHTMITAFGRTQSLTAWAREASMSVSTLKNRLYRAKMPPEEALRHLAK